MNPYAPAIKYGLFIAALLFVVVRIYNYGYSAAETHYKLEIAKVNQKAMEEYNIAQFKAKEEQDKLKDIAKQAQVNYEQNINSYESKLADTSSRLRHKSACAKADSSRVPKGEDTTVPTEQAVDSEFSEEFRQFLLSELKRADGVGAYAQSTYEWVQSLCTTKGVECD